MIPGVKVRGIDLVIEFRMSQIEKCFREVRGEGVACEKQDDDQPNGPQPRYITCQHRYVFHIRSGELEPQCRG
jgi:hypothetical protein